MIYVIFDLEATCWETSEQGQKPNEIIEIGAVKLKDTEPIDEFQTFVKPTRLPILSDFCKQLTQITQEQVDTAPYFQEAIWNFEEWILNGTDNEKIILMSWGAYDKRQLLTESHAKHYDGRIISLLDHHVNLKGDFANIKKVKRCGMSHALDILGLSLQGTHHRGIDDAKNICRIFQHIYNQWMMMTG